MLSRSRQSLETAQLELTCLATPSQTIIESLKYACTGDLPPNTKGGSFVHDPNIAGTSEVKAQVKLRFLNVKKEKMLVERRLEVKKKKNVSGLSMKTLEATISHIGKDGQEKDSRVRVQDTGLAQVQGLVLTCRLLAPGSLQKRNTLSTKCAALDEEISYQLGVSKAILENVIFCHQEESNWPLSEPSALKKKFDDIFEATKCVSVEPVNGMSDAETVHCADTRKPSIKSRLYAKSIPTSSRWTMKNWRRSRSIETAPPRRVLVEVLTGMVR